MHRGTTSTEIRHKAGELPPHNHENERGVLLLPCRHLCVCTGCSERREISSCPLCRDTIAERLIVYS
ncbi:unnamed protein product [Ascophyllum nodosum]